jgi:excinuclease ABC subunit C
LLEQLRKELPNRPGVYGMLDADGRWIYVGKSKHLRTRVMSYFRVKTRASKERRILDRTVSIGWEPAPNEFGALLRELELIQRWRPIYNVKGQPGSRRHSYLCIGHKPAPYLYITERPGRDASAWFGPIPDGMRAKEALRRLNDWFGLRDCPKVVPLAFADQEELFPILRSPGCLRFDLGNCLGPCIADCTEAQYGAKIRAAKAFLSGRDPSPIVQLEREIDECVKQLQFERAGGLHVLLTELRWILEHLGRLRVAKGEYSFVFPQKSVGGGRVWYLVHGGLVVGAMQQPKDAKAAANAKERLSAVFSRAPVEAGSGGVRELDLLVLVASWFRQNPDDLAKTMSGRDAVEFCDRISSKSRRTTRSKTPQTRAAS